MRLLGLFFGIVLLPQGKFVCVLYFKLISEYNSTDCLIAVSLFLIWNFYTKAGIWHCSWNFFFFHFELELFNYFNYLDKLSL